GVGTLPPPPQVLDFKGTCDASIGPACQPATGSQAPATPAQQGASSALTFVNPARCSIVRTETDMAPWSGRSPPCRFTSWAPIGTRYSEGHDGAKRPDWVVRTASRSRAERRSPHPTPAPPRDRPLQCLSHLPRPLVVYGVLSRYLRAACSSPAV